MLKKRGIILLAILLTFIPVSAQEPNTFLTLVDVITKKPINQVFVKVEIDNKFTNYYLEEGENLNLDLEEGSYEVKFLIDDRNTEGLDYYGESLLQVKNNTVKTVYLYPVGSLNGFVKDKLDNVVSGAQLKFDCHHVFNVNYPRETDRFGSFSLDYFPVGKCRIYGNSGGQNGMVEVEVQKGNITTVDITLNQAITNESRPWFAYLAVSILIILVMGIIGGILLIIKKRKKKIGKKEEKPTEKEAGGAKEELFLGQRGKDIFRTLRANEKKIVQFLLEEKDPTHLSKINYKTGISKGALFRNLKSLEEKNLIETSNEGRVKKIKLTAWFLER